MYGLWHYLSAFLRGPEFFQILAKLKGIDLNDKQVDALSCNERDQMLNLNAFVVARNLKCIVATFFTKALLTAEPIGKMV